MHVMLVEDALDGRDGEGFDIGGAGGAAVT